MKNTIAALKLVEFGSRSLLVLACVYAMPAPAAAQFGTATLMVGLFGFAVGFERYLDLQRRSQAMTEPDLDAALASSWRLFLAHYLWAIPGLYLALRYFGGLPDRMAALAIAVAVAEHASQECYRTVLATGRHVPLMAASALRALMLAALVFFHALVDREWLTPDTVLWWWATLGGAGIVLLFPTARAIVRSGRSGRPVPLLEQLRASRWHFAIGLLAVLATQADRFVAVRMLPPEGLASYFRVVMTASAAYQILTFASFNRIARDVYAHVGRGEMAKAKAAFRREKLRYALVLGSVPVLVAVAKAWMPASSAVAALPPPGAMALACAAWFLRGVADFETVVLNHSRRERAILVSNAMALVVTVACSAVLGVALGLHGMLLGSCAGAATGCVLMTSAARSARPGQRVLDERLT